MTKSEQNPIPEGTEGHVPEVIIRGVEELLNSHEVRVLGVMGLFIGYISVFLVKILNFTNMFWGVGGLVLTTLLLLLLDTKRKINKLDWWIRSFTVILLCLFVTSPQLYYAWTVSVTELQNKAETEIAYKTPTALSEKETIKVTISNPRDVK